MDKKVIIILSIILASLIGIIFLISLMINNNTKKAQEEAPEVINQEEVELGSPQDVSSLLLSVKGLIENIDFVQEGSGAVFDNEEINTIIQKMKEEGATKIKTGLGKMGSFCFSLIDAEANNLCVDKDNEGVLPGFNCSEAKKCLSINEELGPILKDEITVQGTTIKRYDDNGSQTVFINDKEYGPYAKVYIAYTETEWGLLLAYDGNWYVNINGKAKGPYVERPVVEAYGEKIGYSYLKDGKYYVSLNGEIFGPYEDLTEFDINNK